MNFLAVAFLPFVQSLVATELWVDLTHPLSPENPVVRSVYTPMVIDADKSVATDVWSDLTLNGTFVAFHYFEIYEHTDTHIDAPHHFYEQRKKLHQLSWASLTGPVVVVDVTYKVFKYK